MTTDPFAAMAASLTPKRAVSYLRVSTREQAQRSGAAEGFSIPAQREANKKKAMALWSATRFVGSDEKQV